MAVRIEHVPYGSDNYAFLVTDEATGEVACVDAGNATAILDAIGARGGRLDQIWITHHHWDHVDGLAAIRSATGARVLGPGHSREPIAGLDQPLSGGDVFTLGRTRVEVLHTPGHTLDMLNYYLPSRPAVFTGDTLFVMGCGRIFEGDADMMWRSLQSLAALPDETEVWCAHEYTLANAAFALSVDPDNPALQARAKAVQEARARGEPTVPSTIGLEKATNPFLRAGDPAIRRRLGMQTASDAEVFARLRALKDRA